MNNQKYWEEEYRKYLEQECCELCGEEFQDCECEIKKEEDIHGIE